MQWSWVKGLAIYNVEDMLAGLMNLFQARCSDRIRSRQSHSGISIDSGLGLWLLHGRYLLSGVVSYGSDKGGAHGEMQHP